MGTLKQLAITLAISALGFNVVRGMHDDSPDSPDSLDSPDQKIVLDPVPSEIPELLDTISKVTGTRRIESAPQRKSDKEWLTIFNEYDFVRIQKQKTGNIVTWICHPVRYFFGHIISHPFQIAERDLRKIIMVKFLPEEY